MKKIAAVIFISVTIFFGTLITAEGFLRVNSWARRELFLREWISREAAGAGRLPLLVVLNHRLWSIFFAEPMHDYRVQAGIGRQLDLSNNLLKFPGRFPEILRDSLLPASGRWHAVDFLRAPNQWPVAKFHVRANSLGFRDPERGPRKKNSRRILVLGAYQAFGHAVNDDETYSSVTEKLLNAYRDGRSYEVWNAGLQSATAIRAHVFLLAKLAELQPDLVILDYGMGDAISAEHNLIFDWPDILFGGTHPLARHLQLVTRRMLASPLGKSFLLTRICARLVESSMPDNIALWREVTQATLLQLAAKKIPVFLLDQAVSGMPTGEYQKLARGRDVTYFSVRRLFWEKPPSAEEEKHFDAGPNWLQEFSPRQIEFVKKAQPGHAYQADFLQVNAAGHRIIAENLAPLLRERLR